jgi:hypothetical protein
MECVWIPPSRQRPDFQSFGMRGFIVYAIEMKEVNIVPQYFGAI